MAEKLIDVQQTVAQTDFEAVSNIAVQQGMARVGQLIEESVTARLYRKSL